MMKDNYYVYALLDSSKPGDYAYKNITFNYEPFYIGKGIGNRIKETLHDKSPFKRNKISKLKEEGIEIISFKIKIELSNEDAILYEKEYIKVIGRRDKSAGTLINLTDGGDGRLSSKPSQITKNKISKTYLAKNLKWNHKKEILNKMSDMQKGKGNGFYGKKHSEETKDNHSNLISGNNHPMYGKTHSDDVKAKLKKHRANKVSNESIRKACQVFNKEVEMFDLDMNYINLFDSVKSASLETNINESIISKCCRGDIKDPTRYYFKYKNDSDNIKQNKFLINKNEYFYYKKEKYKLVKRNKKTCICLDSDNQEIVIHIKDFKYIFEKAENNSNITELFMFIRSMDNTAILLNDVITSKKLKIKYCDIIKYSEIFSSDKMTKEDFDVIIFSDEWKDKKEIIKYRLINLYGKSKKIGARKCDIREIKDNSLIRTFLNDNHLQGFVGSKVKIGLFYEDELVSLITFGSLRKNLGQKSKKDYYELLRFCNKRGFSIMGGASKLFKYFLKKYNPNYILSYADYRWSEGNLYKKLNFKYLNKTISNYFYIIDYNRKNRFNFRKDILVSNGYDINKTEVDIMHEQHHYRIWDIGSLKFTYER